MKKTAGLLAFSMALAGMTTAPAMACRGTVEYPQVVLALAEAGILPAEKSRLEEKLEKGEALHRQAHELGRPDIGQESLAILDEIKALLAQ
jgi:hypothetical protein